MKIAKTLLPLSITLSSILFAGQALAEQTQVRIAGKSGTTSVVETKKDSDLVSDSVSSKATKEPVDLNRTSSYASKQVTTNLKAELQLELDKSPAKTRSEMRAKKSELPEKSEKSMSSSMNHLYVYDASVYLSEDYDADGYYTKISVNFDVDAYYDEHYDVYAELFIRKNGESEWTHYYTTNVFSIYGDNTSDDYTVTTKLNSGFPPGRYEVLIDLFEYGYSGVVDTFTEYDDPDLGWLPLEDKTYESGNVSSDTWVSTVKTEIWTDNDNDGFYRDFTISFDVDTEQSSRDVYAVLYQRRPGFSWEYETETAVFTVVGANADDVISIDAEWQSGYPTDYYDFRIELIDANTGEILDDVSSEFSPLLEVPLEDAGRDTQSTVVNPPPSSTSYGSGGGSWSLLGVSLLGLFGWARRKRS
ncbi:MAG TPA: choice-of-anchor H family protein [Kangiella sp.]